MSQISNNPEYLFWIGMALFALAAFAYSYAARRQDK